MGYCPSLTGAPSTKLNLKLPGNKMLISFGAEGKVVSMAGALIWYRGIEKDNTEWWSLPDFENLC